MKLAELLEDRSAPLYHSMSTNKVDDLVDDDVIYGKWRHYLPIEKRYVLGNSLSRNKKLDFGGDVILTFDQAKLAARFKIFPLNGDFVFHYTRRQITRDASANPREIPKMDHIHDRKLPPNSNFAEEFVEGDIKNAHLYITKIMVRSKYEKDKLALYCEKYGIPIHFNK